jgi:hypothetical protein
MREEVRPREWAAYFDAFSRRNRLRPTRLGVMRERGEAFDDYWIECGLPLAGISVEAERAGGARIEIMLDGHERGEELNLMHTVEGARRVIKEVDTNNGDGGFDIENAEGAKTILRFEEKPRKSRVFQTRGDE